MPEKIITALREYGLLVAAFFHAIGAGITTCVVVVKLGLEALKVSQGKPKVLSEIRHSDAESTLILTKAHSIELSDQLSVMEIVPKMLHEALALEQLLIEKNRIIAEHEDEEYELKIQLEDANNQRRALERQLGLRGKDEGAEAKKA